MERIIVTSSSELPASWHIFLQHWLKVIYVERDFLFPWIFFAPWVYFWSVLHFDLWNVLYKKRLIWLACISNRVWIKRGWAEERGWREEEEEEFPSWQLMMWWSWSTLSFISSIHRCALVSVILSYDSILQCTHIYLINTAMFNRVSSVECESLLWPDNFRLLLPKCKT